MFFVYPYRTTSSVIFDDVSSEDGAASTVTISDEEDKSDELQLMVPHKRRRSSSSSDQFKMYESFAKTMRENHSAKMNLIQQLQTPKEQTELERFFASVCKTVERFPALDQVKAKMKISQIVSEMEFAQLSNQAYIHNQNRNSLSVVTADDGTVYEILDASASEQLKQILP